jgi:hypothetical protein
MLIGNIERKNVVYQYSGMQVSHEKEWSPETYMYIGNMLLSEKSQAQKVTCCMIPFIGNIQKR